MAAPLLDPEAPGTLDVMDRRRFQDNGEPKPQVEIQAGLLFDIEPRGEWVLLRKIFDEETTTEAGVVLIAGEKSSRGIVVAAGPKSELEKDDMVIFTDYPIMLEDLEKLTGDKKLFLVRGEEVYARIKPRPPVMQEPCT